MTRTQEILSLAAILGMKADGVEVDRYRGAGERSTRKGWSTAHLSLLGYGRLRDTKSFSSSFVSYCSDGETDDNAQDRLLARLKADVAHQLKGLAEQASGCRTRATNARAEAKRLDSEAVEIDARAKAITELLARQGTVLSTTTP